MGFRIYFVVPVPGIVIFIVIGSIAYYNKRKHGHWRGKVSVQVYPSRQPQTVVMANDRLHGGTGIMYRQPQLQQQQQYQPAQQNYQQPYTRYNGQYPPVYNVDQPQPSLQALASPSQLPPPAYGFHPAVYPPSRGSNHSPGVILAPTAPSRGNYHSPGVILAPTAPSGGSNHSPTAILGPTAPFASQYTPSSNSNNLPYVSP